MKDVLINICAEDVPLVMLALRIEANDQRRFGHPEKGDRLDEYVEILGENSETDYLAKEGW